MLNRRVAVVCNLKPAKMRGIMSYGMVLCASNDDHTVVEPIKIPEGVPNGGKPEAKGRWVTLHVLLNGFLQCY